MICCKPCCDGVSDISGDTQGDPLQHRKVHMDVEALRLATGETVRDSLAGPAARTSSTRSHSRWRSTTGSIAGSTSSTRRMKDCSKRWAAASSISAAFQNRTCAGRVGGKNTAVKQTRRRGGKKQKAFRIRNKRLWHAPDPLRSASSGSGQPL